MGVYLKGMTIPKCCDDCSLLYDFCCCIVTGDSLGMIQWESDKKRLPDCPLIPVPDHGDLIDRDELSRLVGESFEYFLARLGLKCPKAVIPAERSEE